MNRRALELELGHLAFDDPRIGAGAARRVEFVGHVAHEHGVAAGPRLLGPGCGQLGQRIADQPQGRDEGHAVRVDRGLSGASNITLRTA